MQPQSQLQQLDRVYDLYDRLTEEQAVACHRGCAACCTRNVTVTTLEAMHIHEKLDAAHRAAMATRITAAADQDRFIPRITINGIADRCAAGEELPEEFADPAWSPCPLLVDDECSIYPVRPFHCRCMLSLHDCRRHGYADMPDPWVAMSNLFLQVVEHLDHTGSTGNLIDMLGMPRNSDATPRHPSIQNRPARILMIPPEHRERLAPARSALEAIVAGKDVD